LWVAALMVAGKRVVEHMVLAGYSVVAGVMDSDVLVSGDEVVSMRAEVLHLPERLLSAYPR
jgi:hypothetical protein